MERMFVDPETGDIHPESYYQRENIDLATVIEAIRYGDELGFVIIPENVLRMKVRHQAVFELMKEFALNIAERMADSENEKEIEECREAGMLISVAMLKNLKEIEEERGNANLH